MVQILGWFSAEAACASRWKTGEGLRVSSDLIRQELQGNEAMQPGVLGLVNNAHPTATEFFNDAVMRDGLAKHWTTGERSPWAAMLSAQCPPSQRTELFL